MQGQAALHAECTKLLEELAFSRRESALAAEALEESRKELERADETQGDLWRELEGLRAAQAVERRAVERTCWELGQELHVVQACLRDLRASEVPAPSFFLPSSKQAVKPQAPSPNPPVPKTLAPQAWRNRGACAGRLPSWSARRDEGAPRRSNNRVVCGSRGGGRRPARDTK